LRQRLKGAGRTQLHDCRNRRREECGYRHDQRYAVLNLGPSAGTVIPGAYAMNELVRPASVILTHVNEAVTEGGKLKATSRTAAVMKQLKATSYLAISGRTMEFDGKGKCVAGC
jgi:hypothetical protein